MHILYGYFYTLHLLVGCFLLDVVVIKEPVTLRDLGSRVGDVAREQQQISRLYHPSESHEYHRVQGQGWKWFRRKED